MNKFNTAINTLLLFFVSVMTFAQEARSERAQRADQFSSRYPENGGPEALATDAPTDGGEFVPIDDYTFLLLGIAVLIIAYVMYRRSQLNKA